MKLNTLDLDFNDTHVIMRIALILYKKDCCEEFSAKWSPSMNGIHFTILCKKNCDLCRFVFDDAERFSRDLTRPERTRDVLWNRKVYRKGSNQILLYSG